MSVGKAKIYEITNRIRKCSPRWHQGVISIGDLRQTQRLGVGLLDLVKTRVSQINGCAFCLDMHTKDARARGEAEQRLYALAAWHETPFFSERERAGLAWAETVTRVAETHVPEEAFEHARQYFTEKELVDLTLAIGSCGVELGSGSRPRNDQEKGHIRD